MPKPQLSVVIPCYNEAQNIPLFLKRFSKAISSFNVELILVNNGSIDNTQEILKEELKKQDYYFARTVFIPKNIGYGYGIMFGMKHSHADIIAYTHADMQCDPFDVIRCYKIISEKRYPERFLIKGWRRNRKIVPWLLSHCFQLIATLLFLQKYSEINAQPKVFHRNFLNQLKHPPLDTCLDFYIVHKAKKEKLKIISIPVDFPERRYGESKVLPTFRSKIKVIHNFLKYMFKLRFQREEKASK